MFKVIKSPSETLSLIFLILFILVVSTISMPRGFYPGDSSAIKYSAQKLIHNHEFGLNSNDREKIKVFFETDGQYFTENNQDHKYYSRWGFFPTLISAIPELFNSDGPSLSITKRTILFHNIFNILLTVFIGVLLFKIAFLYYPNPLSCMFFTLTTLYTTYIFNYLRAQSYDIVQLLLFLLYYYSFKKYTLNIKIAKRWFAVLVLALWSLVLIKKIFILFFIPLSLDLLFLRKNFSIKKSVIILTSAVIPVIILFIASKIQFGTYYPIENATAHPFDEREIAFSLGHIGERLSDYLINPKGNLFINFPILAFALLGYRSFFKKYRLDTIFILGNFFIIFILLINYITIGEWCYGPRYFVWGLPILSLPALEMFNRISDNNFSPIKRYGPLIIFLPITFFWFHLQLEVNSRHFFMKYYLQSYFNEAKNKEVDDYFKYTFLPLIVSDFNSFKRNQDFYYPINILTEHLPKATRDLYYRNFLKIRSSYFACGYYFDINCKN